MVRINTGYIEDVMYGRRKSPLASAFLRVLSIPYCLAVFLRQALYAASILPRKKLKRRVISVGNVTLGGTGKTPAVMNIAAVLLKNENRPLVVSRGYGRKNEADLVVVSDGKQVLVDAATGGDEPVLIGSRLAGVPVICGSDRYKAALFALQEFDVDTVILDDGFQHIRLLRNLDIVLVDAADPFGNGRLFPAGILREPLAALRRAQAILLTGVDRVADIEPLKRTISRITKARIFTSRAVPADIVDVTTGEVRPLSALRGTQALAFAGIARPSAFESQLRSLGAEVRAVFPYADHYAYKKSDLAGIFQRAADEKVSFIITTEKDAVRLRPLKPEGIWSLRIELKVVENEEWEAVLLKGI